MIRLNGIEVLAMWGYMFDLIRASGLYHDMGHIANMLYACLDHKMQCWFWADRDLVLITQVQRDMVTGHAVLLVVHANAKEAVADEEWGKIYEKLVSFAKSNKCSEVRAYSDVERVVNLMVEHGFERRNVLRKAV